MPFAPSGNDLELEAAQERSTLQAILFEGIARREPHLEGRDVVLGLRRHGNLGLKRLVQRRLEIDIAKTQRKRNTRHPQNNRKD